MLTAPDGSILDANPAAGRIPRRTREEILQEGRRGLIDSSDPRLAVLIAGRLVNELPEALGRLTGSGFQSRHLVRIAAESSIRRRFALGAALTPTGSPPTILA